MKIFNPKKYPQQEMKNAIQRYEGHLQAKTIPNETDLNADPYLAYIHLVHYVEQGVSKLKSEDDWKKFHSGFTKRSKLVHYSRINTRALKSGVCLIKAWLDAKIAKFDSAYSADAKKGFKDALSAELKINDSITGGKAHHFAMLQHANFIAEHPELLGKPEDYSTQNSFYNEDDNEQFYKWNDLFLKAVSTGFDYNRYTFCQEMVTVAKAVTAGAKKSDKGCLQIVSLADLTFDQIVADDCVYERTQDAETDFTLAFDSSTMMHYTWGLFYLANGHTGHAVHHFHAIKSGMLPRITVECPADSGAVKELKAFWRSLLCRDYTQVRVDILDALVSYNRTSDKKSTRQFLRDQMLSLFTDIDKRGNELQDGDKIKLTIAQLLPLIIRLSGTELSGANSGLLTVAKITPDFMGGRKLRDDNLSQLVKDLLNALLKSGFLTSDHVKQVCSADIPQIQADTGSKPFNELSARHDVKRYIKNHANDHVQGVSKLQVYLQCQASYDSQFGNTRASSPHSLIFLAELELQLTKAFKEGKSATLSREIAGMFEQFCSLKSKAFDPWVLLWQMGRGDSAEGQGLLLNLIRDGKLQDGQTFLSFAANRTLECEYSETNKQAIISYIFGLILLTKDQTQMGVHYLAQAFSLSKGGHIFHQIDGGFLAGLFRDRNWDTLYHLVRANLVEYVEKNKGRKRNHKHRADYCQAIVTNLDKIHQSEHPNRLEKINQFKNETLPMILFLASVSLGGKQRTALGMDTFKVANICKATKNTFYIAVQLLGLTPEEFKIIKNRCFSKQSDSQSDVLLGIQACEKFFGQLTEAMEQFYTKKGRGLEARCLPLMAATLGTFDWTPDSLSEAAVGQFIGSDSAKRAALASAPKVRANVAEQPAPTLAESTPQEAVSSTSTSSAVARGMFKPPAPLSPPPSIVLRNAVSAQTIQQTAPPAVTSIAVTSSVLPPPFSAATGNAAHLAPPVNFAHLPPPPVAPLNLPPPPVNSPIYIPASLLPNNIIDQSRDQASDAVDDNDTTHTIAVAAPVKPASVSVSGQTDAPVATPPVEQVLPTASSPRRDSAELAITARRQAIEYSETSDDDDSDTEDLFSQAEEQAFFMPEASHISAPQTSIVIKNSRLSSIFSAPPLPPKRDAAVDMSRDASTAKI